MQSWKILGYLGLLPFIVCLYLTSETSVVESPARQAFVAYSAIILSFIAGTLWQQDIKYVHYKQDVISNLFSLLAFVSLLVTHKVALVILALSFIFLFGYEKALSKSQKIATNYINMRFWLTFCVVVMHAIAYVLWFV